MTTAKRKSPPEPRDGTGGQSTCDASNIPETGAKGKHPQPDGKAVPPRRTRTAPASRSGARDAPRGGVFERQQRTCAEEPKGKEPERQFEHADPCGGERLSGETPQAVNTTPDRGDAGTFIPTAPAGGGVCSKQTVSGITPDPDSQSRDTARTSKEIPIVCGGDKNAPAGGDKYAPPERPKSVKRILPPAPDIQGITLGIVLAEIEADSDLTASQALVLIVLAKAIISARGVTKTARAALKRETVMMRAKVGCLRSFKRIMAALRPAYIVPHPAQRAQLFEFSPAFVDRLRTRLGVTKMHRQKPVTVTPDPFKPARRNRGRSVDATTPPTPDEEQGAETIFAVLDNHDRGSQK